MASRKIPTLLEMDFQEEVPGRPTVSREIRDLIRKMAQANPGWGAPRVHGELLKLGIEVSERAVSRLMPPRRKPPLKPGGLFSITISRNSQRSTSLPCPPLLFGSCFVLVVLSHQRRRVLHFNVTQHTTAAWAAQQMIEAFPEATAPRYLLRDRDQVYGESFSHRTQVMNITQVLTAPQSPWHSPLSNG